MGDTMNLTAAILLTAGLILLVWTVRKCNPGTVFLSMLIGVAGLFAAELILRFTSIRLPVNITTLACAALGGVPGVILLCVMNLLLMVSY